MPRHLQTALLALTLSVPLSGAALAKVDIVVDLSSQRLTATRAGGESVSWPVSTGRSGFETPRGEYGVERMDLDHHSRKYGDAPMPYAMFFKGGYAIHGTFNRGLGRPASHGCVRLSLGNAALLYDWVKEEGGQIRIEGSEPKGARVASGDRTPARRARRYSASDPYAMDGDDAYYSGGMPAYAREGAPRRSRRYVGEDYGFRDYDSY